MWLDSIFSLPPRSRDGLELSEFVMGTSERPDESSRFFRAVIPLSAQAAMFANRLEDLQNLRKHRRRSSVSAVSPGLYNAAAITSDFQHYLSCFAAQLVNFDRRNIDMNVDTIHQGTGYFSYITLNLDRRAFAFTGRSEIRTGTINEATSVKFLETSANLRPARSSPVYLPLAGEELQNASVVQAVHPKQNAEMSERTSPDAELSRRRSARPARQYDAAI